MRKLISFILAFLCLSIITGQTNNIRINQLGYYPSSTKIALVVWSKSNSFEVLKTSDSTVVFTGELSANNYFTDAADSIKWADFSSFEVEGEYFIKIKDEGSSLPFTISNSMLREVAYGSLKSFYYQRNSFPIAAEFGGLWARKAGHPDTSCIFHSSSGRTGRISSPGGWYDAGDYGKYVVNAGVSVANLLQLYEMFSWYFPDSSLIIPESGNGKNDLLDEVKFELDWIRTMQDTDGGVWHKLTSLQFGGMDLPEKDLAARYIIGKSTTATLDFAAMLAMAGRIYSGTDSAWAAECITMAEKAWNWAIKNPAKYFKNPSDVGTGEYGDSNASDEFIWAASELLTTTKKEEYKTYLLNRKSSLTFNIAGWGNVASLGLQTLATVPNDFDSAENVKIKNSIIARANILVNEINNHPARMTSIGFYWGCNGSHAQAGVALIYAWLFTKDAKYIKAAGEIADYLLGRNVMAKSFFTHYGHKSVLKPHHRPSEGDGIEAAIPGFVAGGPNSGRQDNKSLYPYIPAAKSYIDHVDSYASNEIAINWNGPATFLLAGIDAIMGDSANFVYAPITSANNAPLISMSKPSANALIPQNDSILVNLKVTDNDGIKKIEIYVDNQYISTLTSNFNSTKIGNSFTLGKHTLTLVAYDTRNKVSEKAILFNTIVPTKIDVKTKLSSKTLSIYPNPVNESSVVEYRAVKSGEVIFQCVDSGGKLTRSFSLDATGGNVYSFKLKTFEISSKGVFTINVIQEGQVVSSVRAVQ